MIVAYLGTAFIVGLLVGHYHGALRERYNAELRKGHDPLSPYKDI